MAPLPVRVTGRELQGSLGRERLTAQRRTVSTSAAPPRSSTGLPHLLGQSVPAERGYQVGADLLDVDPDRLQGSGVVGVDLREPPVLAQALQIGSHGLWIQTVPAHEPLGWKSSAGGKIILIEP